MTTPIDCISRAGYFRLGQACVAATCASAFGACCVNGHTCRLLSRTDCTAQQGDYRGDASSCTNGGCTQGSGACCLHDSSCVMVLPEVCASHQGVFRGVNAACSQQYCVLPTDIWACCLSNGTCTALLQRECWVQHGLFRAGVTCTVELCTSLGACCGAGGACSVISQAECTASSSTYSASASCNAHFCPRACPCDWNGDGIVNEGDLFRFVNDFMENRGDFNNDRQCDVYDVFEFVLCMINHPDGC